MPRGPNGERRRADVIGCAVTVAKIATGETSETALKCPGRHASGVASKARAKRLPGKAAGPLVSLKPERTVTRKEWLRQRERRAMLEGTLAILFVYFAVSGFITLFK